MAEVSTILSLWLLVMLVGVALVAEFVLHHIEHWASHRHHHIQPVLKVLYRELMILGIVSFCFIIYEITGTRDKDTILSFEFAHVFIFLLAICYTLVVMFTMYTSLRLSHRWKELEQIDLVRYLHQKDQYTRFRDRIRKHTGAFWRKLQWWFPNFKKLKEYRRLHEVMAFHDIRFQFIFYRNLPEHFRFSSFLRKIKGNAFVELVELHWSLWIVFLIFVLLDIGRREIWGDASKNNEEDTAESVFIIAGAVVLSMFVHVLSVKIRKVYWTLTKNPRVYYEGIQPQDVAAELDAAHERREKSMEERRRRSRSGDGPKQTPGHVADDESDPHHVIPDGAHEQEMVDPMHHHVKRPTARESQDGSGILYNPVNVGNVNIKPRADTADLGIPTNSFDETVARHSLDLKVKDRLNAPTAAARDTVNNKTGDVAIPIEEVAVRHSLELERAKQGGARKNTGAVGGSKATVAKEVVDAARRRSIEVEPRMAPFERQSAEMQRDGDATTNRDRMSREIGGRRRNNQRIISKLSSRLSTDDEARASDSDYGRGSMDERSRKRSIELAAAMPHDELAVRHHGPQRDIESGAQRTRGGGLYHADDDEKLTRYKSFMNPSIVKTLEDREKAKQARPDKYPWFIQKLLPRLNRVASRAEKLFWFGSHHFFLYCVQFTLFFSTVLLAAASGSLFLITVEPVDKETGEKREITGLSIAAAVCAGAALIFVLIHIAGIMKKYIFVLNNASLVSETEAIEAIHTVSKKGTTFVDFDDGFSDLSGDETEREDQESARERRRAIGNFFRSEAQEGNVEGIDAAEARASNESLKGSSKKSRTRTRRLSRMREVAQDIPAMP